MLRHGARYKAHAAGDFRKTGLRDVLTSVIGQSNSRQDAYDRNDDEQLNEGQGVILTKVHRDMLIVK
jgi:hypothetical protein